MEYCLTLVCTRYKSVFKLGALAKQLMLEVAVTSADDVTVPPLSVNFKIDWSTLMYTDDGQSMPHTIPVTPAPEYHWRHTWSGVQAMTLLDMVYMNVVFMPLSWKISIIVALYAMGMWSIVL
jgi:hypothetical protein